MPGYRKPNTRCVNCCCWTPPRTLRPQHSTNASAWVVAEVPDPWFWVESMCPQACQVGVVQFSYVKVDLVLESRRPCFHALRYVWAFGLAALLLSLGFLDPRGLDKQRLLSRNGRPRLLRAGVAAHVVSQDGTGVTIVDAGDLRLHHFFAQG